MIKRIMKVQSLLTMILFSIVLGMTVNSLQVEAASFSASASVKSVDAKDTFTITYGAGTVGGYTFSVSGGSIDSTSAWLERDDNGGTLTVTAGSSGTVEVTITSGDQLTTFDYEDITPGTSKTVSVSINEEKEEVEVKVEEKEETTTTTTPEVVVDTRSSDNYLSALSIDGVELSPSFASSETAYTAEVLDIDEVTISATKNHSSATVSGTGTKTLEIGENVFYIVVTAENGSTRTYGITIVKNESPTIYFDYNGESLGVVKNLTEVEVFPNFDLCKLESDEETFDGWYSSQLDMTIVYLITEDGTEGFYVYEEGIITSEIRMVVIYDTNYFVFDLSDEEQVRTGYIYEEVTINDISVMGWGFESADFADYKIIQLMNEDGVLNDYLYSVLDDIFIIAPDFTPVNVEEYNLLIEEKLAQELTIEEQSAEIESLNSSIEAQSTSIGNLKVLGTVLAILVLGLIVAIVVCAVKSRKYDFSNKGNSEEMDIDESELEEDVLAEDYDIDEAELEEDIFAEDYDIDEDYDIAEETFSEDTELSEPESYMNLDSGVDSDMKNDIDSTEIYEDYDVE